MNLELFGAIIAHLGIVWAVIIIAVVYLQYRELNDIGKKLVTINLNKQLLVLVVSIVYLFVFYTS